MAKSTKPSKTVKTKEKLSKVANSKRSVQALRKRRSASHTTTYKKEVEFVYDEVSLGENRKLSYFFSPGTVGTDSEYKTPLVMLHGLLDSKEGWSDLVVNADYPCLAFDLPGFGKSSLPKENNFLSYAKDVQEALQILGLKEYNLIGHSLGGGIAAELACLDKEKVCTLLLLAPAGFGRNKMAEFFSKHLFQTLTERGAPVVLANPLIVSAVYSTMVSHHRLASSDLIKRIAGSALHVGPGINAAVESISTAGLSKNALYKRPCGFDGPVYALWGKHDKLVPIEHSKRLKKIWPHANIEVWEKMAHHPQWERPKKIDHFIKNKLT